MTRLTNEIRDNICSSAIKAAFLLEGEKLAKEENDLGTEMYESVFDAPTRKVLAKVPDGWLRLDGCLRFNCSGYDLRFKVNAPKPVPSRGYGCERLGNITGELAERGQSWGKKSEDLRSRQAAAVRQLDSMLSSVSSVSTLQKTWPQGLRFYERYLETKAGSSVPAVQIAEINSMLGLAEAA